jgi:hypothetical protein
MARQIHGVEMSTSLRDQLLAIKSALKVDAGITASVAPTKPKKRVFVAKPEPQPATPVTITVTPRPKRTFTSKTQLFSMMVSTPLKQGDFNKPDQSRQGEVRCGTQSICNKMAVYK